FVEYTIRTDFAHLLTRGERFFADGPPFGELVGRWFASVCRSTARLVVDWMRVGFVHGVLNTDNMSILGLTIDYGPYGWMESYDPDWTPNTTDAATHRYRFGGQQQVAHWNLLQLANALVRLTGQPQPLQDGLDLYRSTYDSGFADMMAERLGLGRYRSDDVALFDELFQLMQRSETDFILFLRHLAGVSIDPAGTMDDDDLIAPLAPAWYRAEEIVGHVRSATIAWVRAWGRRVTEGGLDDAPRIMRMNAVNPLFVLRNSLAQEAIDAAELGDLSVVHTLQEVLRRPYDDQPGREHYCARRPEWARHRVGCSMLSCSS
ncbi:MAG: protein adenylyltransferase SelO family protein, partial [Ilumatobacteraceae bacterium]